MVAMRAGQWVDVTVVRLVVMLVVKLVDQMDE